MLKTENRLQRRWQEWNLLKQKITETNTTNLVKGMDITFIVSSKLNDLERLQTSNGDIQKTWHQTSTSINYFRKDRFSNHFEYHYSLFVIIKSLSSKSMLENDDECSACMTVQTTMTFLKAIATATWRKNTDDCYEQINRRNYVTYNYIRKTSQKFIRMKLFTNLKI